ncbi:MAG: putative baseplate assembly protein [Thermoanaerobaculia bacterium]
MSLPLPNLDDRRWADLVDEGRTRIPVYAPEWTDHNVHDPGITVIELLAWVAEMGIYRANRVPAAHLLKFLELVGYCPEPPRGARALVGFELAGGAPVTVLPGGLQVTTDPVGPLFRTEREISIVPGELAAIQVQGPTGLEDLSTSWRRGETLAALGSDPTPDSALYLAFTAPLPTGAPASLYFDVEGGAEEERLRLLALAEARREACEAPEPGIDCTPCEGEPPAAAPDDPETEPETPRQPPRHHSARLAWEIAVAPGVWRPLSPAAGEINDGTRSLTLSGGVELRPPVPMAQLQLGEVAEPLHYLRVRQAGGAFDAPPRIRAIQLNGLVVRQEAAVSTDWPIAPGATVTGPIPAAGDHTGVRFGVDAGGMIDSLDFVDSEPRFRALGYQAPTAEHEGRLELEAALLGVGSGKPEQSFDLPRPMVAGDSLRVVSFEAGAWQEWSRRPDWTRSSRRDAHFLVDPVEGEVSLGDGETGRVLPRDAFLVATYDLTGGAAGNLPAGSLSSVADNANNRALAPDFELLLAQLDSVEQPLAASGGNAGESLAETAARALEDLETPQRAVTLDDIETLTLETPGVRLARVFAIANLHPAFPCMRAPGVVTVVVLPSVPSDRPVPSRGLRRQVRAWLSARRVLGTRIEVVGPEYIRVRVRATVRACPLVDLAALAESLTESLDSFLHPLTGGPEGNGWPFGRDVYRSEVLQVLDETEGADHVVSLEFIRGDCGSVCGNVCLPPTGLVEAADHEIEVV